MEKKMSFKSSSLIFESGKELRNQMTHSEVVLWGYLRQRPLGFKFRRQHPIHDYIADFFSFQLKLVIEVDAGMHAQSEIQQKDKEREEWLQEQGLSILRFTNFEVERSLEIVILTIENKILLITNNRTLNN